MLDVHARDLAVLHFHRHGVRAVRLDDVFAVRLDLVAQQLLAVFMLRFAFALPATFCLVIVFARSHGAASKGRCAEGGKTCSK